MFINEGYLNQLEDEARRTGYMEALNDVLFEILHSEWIKHEDSWCIDIISIKDKIKALEK